MKLTEITFESFRQYRKLVWLVFFPLRLLCLTKHHKSQHTPQNLRSILDTRKYQVFLKFLSRPIKLEYGSIQHQYQNTLFLFLFLAKGFWKNQPILINIKCVQSIFLSLPLIMSPHSWRSDATFSNISTNQYWTTEIDKTSIR